MRKDRLAQVAEAIRAHEQSFDYGFFAVSDLGVSLETADTVREILNDCGTVGCVAGFTCALFAKGDRWMGCISAGDLLGISWQDQQFLFHGEIGHGFGRVNINNPIEATAAEAISRIEALIKSEEPCVPKQP